MSRSSAHEQIGTVKVCITIMDYGLMIKRQTSQTVYIYVYFALLLQIIIISTYSLVVLHIKT